MKNEESLRKLWDNIKFNDICIMVIPKGEQTEQRIKNLLEEMMTKNFPNLIKEKDISLGSSESQTS